MGTDHAVVANFCKNPQGGIHSNENIISDSGAMDDGSVPHDHIIPNDDVRYPCMDDTVILDAGIASNLNSKSIRS